MMIFFAVISLRFIALVLFIAVAIPSQVAAARGPMWVNIFTIFVVVIAWTLANVIEAKS